MMIAQQWVEINTDNCNNISEAYKVPIASRFGERETIKCFYYVASDEDGYHYVFDSYPKFLAFAQDETGQVEGYFENFGADDYWEAYQDDDGNDMDDGETNWDYLYECIDDKILEHYKVHNKTKRLGKDAYKECNDLSLFPLEEEAPHAQAQGR